MEAQVKRMYSEVYGILNMMGTYYINKLPKKLYNLVETQKEETYNPQYNLEIGLEKQNITSGALAMIMLFHLNYWCETKEEKEAINKILEKNEKEVSEKYDIAKIFKQKEEQRKTEMERMQKEESKKETEKFELVKYNDSFFQKIKRKIYNFFHKNDK